MVSFSPIPAPGAAPESADGTLAGGAFGRVPGGSAITRGTAKRIIDRIHRDVSNAAAHPGIGDAHPLASGREAAAAERAALGSDALRAREAELSEAITELTREKNRAEAKRARAIAELREVTRERFLRENQEIDPNTGPLSSGENEILHTQLAEEIALAVTAGRPTGTALLADAMTVTEDLPRVWAAYEAGLLDQRRVHLIGQATGGATPQTKRIMDAQLAELASTLTPGTLIRVARALRDRVDPVSPEARHASAFERRAVWLDPRGDGMADLTIHAAAPELAAILDRAQTLAKHLADEEKAEHAERVATAKQRHEDEAPEALTAALDTLPQPRGIGQLRADVMVELLLSGETDGTDTTSLWSGFAPTETAPDQLNVLEVPDVYPRDKGGPLPPWSLSPQQRAEWFPEGSLPPREPELELLTPVSLRPKTSPPPGIRGSVNVTVPARLLAGIRHDLDPGDTDEQVLAKEFALLNGVTVLDDESALRIASGLGNLRNLYVDDEGALLDVGRDSYAPPVSLRRFAEIRDRHCRFPGCERPATNCDLDHSIPWQHGGHTKHDNLAHLCRSHHTMKSRGDEQHAGNDRHRGWRLISNVGGVLTWETLSGRRVSTRPERPTVPRGS